MNEAGVVRRIIENLTKLLPGVVILKHADLVSAGVPDLSVTYGGRTWWTEVKYFPTKDPPPSEIKKSFDALQLVQLGRLNGQGRGRYLVAVRDRYLLLGSILPAFAAIGVSEKFPLSNFTWECLGTFEYTIAKFATRIGEERRL